MAEGSTGSYGLFSSLNNFKTETSKEMKVAPDGYSANIHKYLDKEIETYIGTYVDKQTLYTNTHKHMQADIDAYACAWACVCACLCVNSYK